jgi:hypothetical protein
VVTTPLASVPQNAARAVILFQYVLRMTIGAREEQMTIWIVRAVTNTPPVFTMGAKAMAASSWEKKAVKVPR